jgi:tungstate transport system substrate-binding protein
MRCRQPGVTRCLRFRTILTVAGIACTPAAVAAQQPDDVEIVLATTTSVRDAGLLDDILPPFERETGHRVKVIAVGSGQAMELGRRGEADILIVHDPGGEEAFMRQGYGEERIPLMRNRFVIVGPRDDPAGIRDADPLTALQRIAASHATFVSRADHSGTHTKELRLWTMANRLPAPEWYRESGQSMGATLQIASELQAYTLTDVGTLLGHKGRLDLVILVAGDPLLDNPYHILLPSHSRFPRLNAAGARRMADYLRDPATQARITAFGRVEHGQSLFEGLPLDR